MDKMSIEQFGATIKQKYPQYSSFSDADIGQKTLAKYPQYQDKINTSLTQNKSQISQPTLTGADNPVGSLPVIKQATQLGTGIGSAIGSAGLNVGKALLKISHPIASLLGVGKENEETQQGLDTINQKVFQ